MDIDLNMNGSQQVDTSYENPETGLNDPLNGLDMARVAADLKAAFAWESNVIDLRRRFDIKTERIPYPLSMPPVWQAIDLVTFDDDPEARLHIIGLGASREEATVDLLEQLAEVAVAS